MVIVRASTGEMMDGPHLLPDGDSLLFSVVAGAPVASADRWDRGQIVLQSLRSGERRVLLEGGSDARYVATGHLVYALDDGLLAVRFDLARREVRGGPVSVVQGVNRSPGLGSATANYAVADDGTLFYTAGSLGTQSGLLSRVDRAGRSEPIATIPAPGLATPRLSSDGRRLLAIVQGNVRVYDLETGRERLVTTDGLSVAYAGWSPDDRTIAYSSTRNAPGGALNVWLQAADGSGTARQVTALEGLGHFDDWSPDGRTLLVHHHSGRGTGTDVLAVPVGEAPADPQPFLNSSFPEDAPVFSPDGRHVAYVSNETGQYEIYIRPFPGPGSQIPVSVDGGVEPEWARNGELFYRRLKDYRMIAVSVRSSGGVTVGPPTELFRGPAFPGGAVRARYAVTADGTEFVVNNNLVATGEAPAALLPTVRVIQHWTEELKRLVPGN